IRHAFVSSPARATDREARVAHLGNARVPRYLDTLILPGTSSVRPIIMHAAALESRTTIGRIEPWHAIGFLTALSFALGLAEIPRSDWFTLATLSLASGVTAFSLMGTAAVLGGRWHFIEALFGGLDRVYLAHKWLGVWALGFASVHLAFKAGMDGW